MAGTVTSQLTNITLAEVGDDAKWDDTGSGPGSSQDTDIFVEGTESRGRRVDNTTNKGFGYDNTSTLDLSAAGTHVAFWINILHPAAITNVDLTVGGGINPTTSPYDNYRTYDATFTYPTVGGFQRVWIDLARVRDGGAGAVDFSVAKVFAVDMSIADVGGSGRNLFLDRIDYATGGLLVDSGTAPSPATFADLTAADGTNAYGVIVDEEGVLFVFARVTIADATATVFNDSGFVVVFADQRLVSDDFMGLRVDLQNASTDVDFANGLIQSGGAVRGSFVVEGTSGAFDASSCTFSSLRRILVTGACTFVGSSFVESGQIDPTNGDYSGEMSLPGTDEYVKTTTNVDMSSASSDLKVTARFSLADWTPAANQFFIANNSSNSASGIAFYCYINTSGAPAINVSDGFNTTSFVGSALALAKQITPTQGNALWVRVRYDHSLGQAFLWESLDSADTPIEDISWTAAGTPTGTARSVGDVSAPLMVGATNSATPQNFCDGIVNYIEVWKDGWNDAANLGTLVARGDWRTGPDFTSGTRNDDASSLVWQEQGTAPAYTQGENNSTAADLGGSAITNSTSAAALRWNVNTDPAGELDNVSFVSAGTGHALELGPNCPATIELIGHSYTSYAGTDGSTGNEVIYNNSGKSITIDVTTGDIPTIRNGSGASTTVNNNVSHTLTGLQDNSEVTYVRVSDSAELFHVENSSGGSTVYEDNYVSDTNIRILVFHQDYEAILITTTLTDTAQTIPISQTDDRVFDNPV
jgi:hypothetical protein